MKKKNGAEREKTANGQPVASSPADRQRRDDWVRIEGRRGKLTKKPRIAPPISPTSLLSFFAGEEV